MVNENKQKVKVSVCMITYNHAEYIEKAINGVYIQKTNFKFELIISDDASPDKTEDVVNKFLFCSNDFIDIVYYKHPKNIGAIKNLKWTLNKCSGKYIALCEGDDYWTDPYKLQKQIDFLEQNKSYVLVFHNRFKLVQNNQSLDFEKILQNSQSVNFHSILENSVKIPTQTVVFKNLIEEYPKEFTTVVNGDTFLFLLLAQKGDFYFMEELDGAVYRVHDLGIWSSKEKVDQLREGIKTFKIFLKVFNEDKFVIKVLLKRRVYLLKYYFHNKSYFDLLIFLFGDFNIYETLRLRLKYCNQSFLN